MSKEELHRLDVMKRLQEQRIHQRNAAEELGVSIRHVKRLLRAYRREGAAWPGFKAEGTAEPLSAGSGYSQASPRPSQGTLLRVWANAGARETGGAGRTPTQPGEPPQAHDRRRIVESEESPEDAGIPDAGATSLFWRVGPNRWIPL